MMVLNPTRCKSCKPLRIVFTHYDHWVWKNSSVVAFSQLAAKLQSITDYVKKLIFPKIFYIENRGDNLHPYIVDIIALRIICFFIEFLDYF